LDVLLIRDCTILTLRQLLLCLLPGVEDIRGLDLTVTLLNELRELRTPLRADETTSQVVQKTCLADKILVVGIENTEALTLLVQLEPGTTVRVLLVRLERSLVLKSLRVRTNELDRCQVALVLCPLEPLLV